MPGPVLYKTIRPLPSKIVYLRQTAEPTLVGYRNGRNLRFAPVALPASKSGNKLPTSVQKVYLRLGKKVHQLMNNFIPCISLQQKDAHAAPLW